MISSKSCALEKQNHDVSGGFVKTDQFLAERKDESGSNPDKH
jgi:hypothetical protein